MNVDIIKELHPDPDDYAEVRRLVDLYNKCEPDPECSACEGSGYATGKSWIRRTFIDWLRQRPREWIPYVEVCPVCLGPQWDAIDREAQR